MAKLIVDESENLETVFFSFYFAKKYMYTFCIYTYILSPCNHLTSFYILGKSLRKMIIITIKTYELMYYYQMYVCIAKNCCFLIARVRVSKKSPKRFMIPVKLLQFLKWCISWSRSHFYCKHLLICILIILYIFMYVF